MDNNDLGRDPPGQALVASDGAASVSTLSGFDPSREVMFSTRNAVFEAIMVPGSRCDRISGEDWTEDFNHWQARAAIDTVFAEIGRSPHFRNLLAEAIAMETRSARTAGHGPKDDSAGPEAIAQ